MATWRRKVGNSSGAISGYNLVPIAASAMPKAPPASDSSRFSVTSCFTSRPRPAPAAARSASSFCRPTPATRSRLATFAQPMSRTKPTVPTRKVSMRSVPRNSDSCNGTTRAPSCPGLSPRASFSCRLMAAASAAAASGETPGFSLPTAVIHRACGIFRRSLAAQKATSSTPGVSTNPRGITPMTMRGSPSTRMVRADGVRGAVELALPGVVADDDAAGFLLLHDVVEVIEPVGAPEDRRHAGDRQARSRRPASATRGLSP